MTKIPTDILKKARSYIGDNYYWIGPDELAEIIAIAIMDERNLHKRGENDDFIT